MNTSKGLRLVKDLNKYSIDVEDGLRLGIFNSFDDAVADKAANKTAELIKYFNNVFFAVKVSFANEMKKVCEAIDANWDVALSAFVADSRVADSHLHVPGPDGKSGFGGTCFPKDLCAFITFAENLNTPANVIKGAWDTNLEVRPSKDWEKLKGRAVVDENSDSRES